MIRTDSLALFLVALSMLTGREISFILIVIANALYLFKHSGLSKNVIMLLQPFLLLCLLGFIASLFFSFEPLKVFKDIAYFLWPVLLASLAYFIFRKKEQVFFIKIIISGALLNGIIYLLRLIKNIDQLPMLLITNSVEQFREVLGTVNELIPYGLFLIILFKYPKNNLIRLVIGLFLSICIILSFSRSILIFLFLLFLAHHGYLDIKRKKIVSFLLIIAVTIVSLPLATKIFPKESLIGSFVNKTSNSLSEISSDADYSSLSNIYRSWRGYEVHQLKKGIENLNNPLVYIIGKGFGSEVDLEIDVELGGTIMRKIPHLHNGYMYLLMKTGIIGIILYLIFHIRLYFNSYKTNDDFVKTNIQFWVFYSLFASLVITGVFNFSSYYIFIVFAILSKNNLIGGDKKTFATS